jgi:DNA-binding XRE family transcriptional regulator
LTDKELINIVVEKLRECPDSSYVLQQKTGIHQGNFQNWRKGKFRPNIEYARKIAKHFGIITEESLPNHISEPVPQYSKQMTREKLLERIVLLTDENSQLRTELAKANETIKRLGGPDQEKRNIAG